MKTIIWKELREQRLLPIIALFTIAIATVLAARDTNYILNHESFVVAWTVCAGPYAAILGLSQFFRDARPESRALLLHRGLSAKRIFWAKCAAGVLLFASAVTPPILGALAWVALNNQFRFAGYPSQLLPAAAMGLLAFLCWPAGALAVQRDSRLFGSRILALPCAGLALLIASVLAALSLSMVNFLLSLLLAITVLAILLQCAQAWFIQPRQFVKLPRYALGLLNASAITAVALGCIFTLVDYMAVRTSEGTYYSVNLDTSGRALLTARTVLGYDQSGGQRSLTEVAELTSDGDAENRLQPASDGLFSVRHFVVSRPGSTFGSPEPTLQYLGSLERPIYTADDPPEQLKVATPTRRERRFWHFVLDNSQGEVLVYTERRKLSHRLTPEQANGQPRFGMVASKDHWNSFERVTDRGDDSRGPMHNGKELVIEFDEGVYVFNNRGEVKELLPLDRSLARQSRGVTLSQGFARLLRFQDRLVLISPQVEEFDDAEKAFTIDGVQHWSKDIQLPGRARDAVYLQAALLPRESEYALATLVPHRDDRWDRLLHDDNGNVADSAEYRQRIPDSQSPSRYRAALGALPLAWSIVSISYGLAILPSDQVRIMEAVNELFTTVPLTGVVLAVQVILGVLLCWLACRIRIVSATSTRWWMMTGFFIGPATALAILTVYPKVIRSSCAACGNATRVDRCECEHCDEPLSPVSRLGIEIFDSEETMPSNRRAEAIAS